MVLDFIEDLEYGGGVAQNRIDDSIYLENENEILKLILKFNHMDIREIIVDYIQGVNIYNLKALDDISIESEYKTNVSFFPFIGKFKLEGNFKKTNNYLVPPNTELLRKLIGFYNCNNNFNNSISYHDLNVLNSLYKLSKEQNNILEESTLKNLFSKIHVQLVERLDKTLLKNVINSNNMINKDEYRQIKFLLVSASENKEIFNEFGLINNIEKQGLINNNKKQKHI